MKIIDLGLIDYAAAYEKQKEVLTGRKSGVIPDTLIIAEHLPVFTLGRSGSRDNLLVDKKVLEQKRIELIEVDRGGDITYHGPGQLVAYPIIDLKQKMPDLHKYIRQLEEVLIGFLNDYNINGQRVKGKSGVWAQGSKIGFVGIGASRWTSFHGVSININTDLGYFSMIASCGIKGIEITSLAKILGRPFDMEEAKRHFISSFKKIFSPVDEAQKIPVLA